MTFYLEKDLKIGCWMCFKVRALYEVVERSVSEIRQKIITQWAWFDSKHAVH